MSAEPASQSRGLHARAPCTRAAYSAAAPNAPPNGVSIMYGRRALDTASAFRHAFPAAPNAPPNGVSIMYGRRTLSWPPPPLSDMLFPPPRTHLLTEHAVPAAPNAPPNGVSIMYGRRALSGADTAPASWGYCLRFQKI
ncbi:hypothetical protein R3P38DRAFT_3204065 [Favolaschia claudopus]|uniref:Uncharacterized protein n=1 Tax=Favolaschia claudopus TaxID=2862362 RepID=A0AAW0ASL7_9AGAR